jgi:hypothetical protein
MTKIQFTHETDRNKFHSPQSVSKGAERNTIQLLTKGYSPSVGESEYYGAWGRIDGSPNDADTGKERYCRRLK